MESFVASVTTSTSTTVPSSTLGLKGKTNFHLNVTSYPSTATYVGYYPTSKTISKEKIETFVNAVSVIEDKFNVVKRLIPVVIFEGKVPVKWQETFFLYGSTNGGGTWSRNESFAFPQNTQAPVAAAAVAQKPSPTKTKPKQQPSPSKSTPQPHNTQPTNFKPSTPSEIPALFLKHADASQIPPILDMEGLSDMLTPCLGEDVLSNPRCLTLIWSMLTPSKAGVSSEKPGEVSEKEFVVGLETVGVRTLVEFEAYVLSDSLDVKKIYNKKPHVTSLSSSSSYSSSYNEPPPLPLKDFKSFYTFAFTFNLEATRKTLERTLASALLTIVFPTPSPSPHVSLFAEFLVSDGREKGVVTLDEWKLFLSFIKQLTTVEALEGYEDGNEGGAWPCLLDDYVEYVVKSKKAQATAVTGEGEARGTKRKNE